MSIMSKADMVEVENLSRSDDPSQAFLAAEEYMDSLHSIDLQSDNEMAHYFVATCLPRIIISLLKRSDLDEDVEERAYMFLESTLLFIARTIDCGMEQLPLLLDEIFMERSHPFYVNSRSPSEISEIGDADSGPEVFEDETRARRATFALRQPGRVHGRRGRGSCSEGRLIGNINAFGRFGGFRRLKDAIMQAADPSQIARVRNLLSPVFEVKEFLATDFLDWFMTVFHHIADHILLRLSDEDLKNEFRSINDIVNSLCGLYRISSSASCQEHIDKLKLELALKGLKSRYLERRLSGLGDINDLLDTLAGQMVGDNRGGQDGPCWADPEFMCGWLKANEVLEEIFVHNVHTEVLKRSRRILMFLSEWGELGEKEVHMMWESSLGKHESIEKLIIDLLGQVARHLRTVEALQGLLKLVSGLEPSAFTTQHIELVRRITCLMIQMEKKEGSTVDHFMGINILWNMIQDDFQFSLSEMHNFCLQCFVGLLELQECRQVRGEYFRRCVENLREHNSVPQSLMVMNGLFLAIAVKRKQPDVDWASFGCVQDEQELLDLVLADLMWYQGLPISSMDIDAGEEGLGPRYSRQEELQQRLSFISSVLELEGGSLKEQHLDCLWETLVKKAVNSTERDLVFGWLEGLLRCRWTRDRILPVLESLFAKHICTQDPSSISEVGFRLARYTMTLINSSKSWLADSDRNGDNGKVMITTTEQLVGTPFVWEVAVGARNQSVAQQAISFLNEVYQNLSSSLQPLRELMESKRHEFIASCMEHVQKAAGDANVKKMETRVSRCVWLLTSFLKEFEGNVASTKAQQQLLLRKHSVAAQQVQARAALQPLPDGSSIALAKESSVARANCSSSSGSDMTDPEEEREEREEVRKGEELQTNHTTSDGNGEDNRTIDSNVSGAENMVTEEGANQVAANRDVRMTDGCSKPRCSEADERSPHDILSQKYFDQIFRLLEASSGRVSAQVWDLVGLLPTNDDMLSSLRRLEPGWADSLAAAGLYSLLYKMQIVERLMAEDAEWRERFVASGGLAAVLQVMLGVVFEAESSTQKNACLAILLKLVSTILTADPCVTPEDEDNVNMADAITLEKHLKSNDDVKLFVHGLMKILAKMATATPALHTEREGGEKVVQYAVKLFTACAAADTRVLRYMFEFNELEGWLRTTLLLNRNQSIRLSVAKGILRMAWKQDGEWHTSFSLVDPANKGDGAGDPGVGPSSCPHPLLWLLSCLLSLASHVEAGSTTCGELFDLVNCLLIKSGHLPEQFAGDEPPGTRAERIDRLEKTWGSMLDSAGARLQARMYNHAIFEERGSEVEDRVLLGMLVTMQSLVMLRPALRHELGPSGPKGPGLVKFIYCDCLFDLPTVENHHKCGPPMCKMGTTRTAGFELLFTLVQDSKPAYNELLALLTVQHSKNEVRPLHGYRPTQLEKARCGFVGMRNLGATCYMNSLLQHLFNVHEFRRGILQAPLEQTDKGGSLMYQLQSLFGYLQESEKQFAETWEMCQVYTDYDGQPINTAVQMDADEFFNMLFEKLESCLKGTDQEHLLQECFGGKVVNQIICKEEVKVGDKVYGLDNPFKSEREESFYTLSLEVKHKRSILESLELFVEGEVLEGDNKYFCEEANCKVSAVKRVCVKQLPPTLILHLKRFEFDLDLMKKIKVNDSCEFPIVLNMEPYTRDGIERRERAQREGRPAPPTPRGLDTEYELVGVLVHTGTSDSGHYYSYIKVGGDGAEEDDGMWYLFNDTQVEAFDDDEIPAACYGGKEYVQDADGSCRAQAKSRTYSAYMLLYRQRRSMAARAQAKEADVKVAKANGVAPSINGGVPVPQEIMETVWSENIQLLRDKLVFDPAYLTFTKRVCSLHRFLAVPEDGQALQQGLEQGRVVLELATRILMDTVIHAWGSAEVESWVELIQSLLPGGRDGVERSRWLLDMFMADVEERGSFISHLWLFKGLVANRNLDARTSIVALLGQAARTVAEEERSVSWEPNQGQQVPFCFCDSSEESDSGSDSPLTPRAPRAAAGPQAGAKAAVKRPSLTNNYPTSATTLARFIDKALELLPELPPHWRHFGEYFQLFSIIADFGPQEKAFFLSRRVVGRCVDVFLHEDSPFAREHRHRIRMGDKLSSPNFTYMMDLVTKLVCSVELEREVEPPHQEVPAPTQLPVVGVLDNTSANMVRHKLFIKKLLVDVVNPPKTRQLLQHLSWNHPRLSCLVLTAACEVVESEEEYGVLFQILKSLINLQDAFVEGRTDKFVVCFLKALYNNLQYPEACVRCLELLAEEISENPLLRQMVLRAIILQNRRRDVCRWFEACLLRSEGETIRLAAEQVALAIAFPALRSASAQADAGTPRGTLGGGPAVQARATADQQTKTLFEHLILMDEALLHTAAAVDRPRGFSCSPLASYVRCLSTMVQLSEDGWFKAQFRRHFAKFHQLLDALNELGHEMDVSKAELIRLFYFCALDSPETLDLLTDQFSGVRESLLGYYIIIRPHKAHIIYNRQNLPFLYNLLLLCCRHSTSFTVFLMGHRNSMWAVDNFICSSTRYPETLAVLLQIVDVALATKGHPEVLAEFKQRLLRVLLGSKAITNCPDNAVALFRRLVDDVLVNAEDLHELLESSVLECMFIGLAQSHPTCSGTGRRAFTPQEDTIAYAIRILHKVLQALEAKKVEEDALKTALKKCKCRTLGIQALFKALQDPSLHRGLRPAAFDVCARLCAVDPACGAAGVSELQRAYEATKLKSLGQIRMELARSVIEDANGETGDVGRGGAKKGEDVNGKKEGASGATAGESTKNDSSQDSAASGRPTGEDVVELWPQCRGPTEDREAGLILDSQWWELCEELCQQCVEGAEDGGPARWQAIVRLILSCVLDCVPDSMGDHGKSSTIRLSKIMDDLLLDCMAVKAGDGEGTKGGGVVKTESDADWVLEAVRGDEYSSAFPLRAILCYKSLLGHDPILDVVVALLKLVVPTWERNWIRKVVQQVFADLLEYVEVVKGMKGVTDQQEAVSAYYDLTEELNPFFVLQRVPGLLSMAVELRGDNACCDEVEQALEVLQVHMTDEEDQDGFKRLRELMSGMSEAMRQWKQP